MDVDDRILAPRFDVWAAFAVSSCAAGCSIILILGESRLNDDTPFSAVDALALSTCGLSFLVGAVITCGIRFAPFRRNLTKYLLKAIEWGKFDELSSHHRRDDFVGSLNLTAEWILLTILFLLWIVTMSLIVNSDDYHYSRMDGTNGAEMIWDANLFFSSWISFSLCTYLWIEVWTSSNRGGTIRMANSRRLPSNAFTKRWTLLLFAAVVVFTASITTYTGLECRGTLLKQTSDCSRLMTGIVMGGVFQMILSLSVGILYRLTNMRRGGRRSGSEDACMLNGRMRDLWASIAALVSIVAQGFNVALLTSPTGGGPGNASGTLYFGSWLGFVLSFELCLRYSDLCGTSGSGTSGSGLGEECDLMEDVTVYDDEECEEYEEDHLSLRKCSNDKRKKKASGWIDDGKTLNLMRQKSFEIPVRVSVSPDPLDDECWTMDCESYVFPRADFSRSMDKKVIGDNANDDDDGKSVLVPRHTTSSAKIKHIIQESKPEDTDSVYFDDIFDTNDPNSRRRDSDLVHRAPTNNKMRMYSKSDPSPHRAPINSEKRLYSKSDPSPTNHENRSYNISKSDPPTMYINRARTVEARNAALRNYSFSTRKSDLDGAAAIKKTQSSFHIDNKPAVDTSSPHPYQIKFVSKLSPLVEGGSSETEKPSPPEIGGGPTTGGQLGTAQATRMQHHQQSQASSNKQNVRSYRKRPKQPQQNKPSVKTVSSVSKQSSSQMTLGLNGPLTLDPTTSTHMEYMTSKSYSKRVAGGPKTPPFQRTRTALDPYAYNAAPVQSIVASQGDVDSIVSAMSGPSPLSAASSSSEERNSDETKKAVGEIIAAALAHADKSFRSHGHSVGESNPAALLQLKSPISEDSRSVLSRAPTIATSSTWKLQQKSQLQQTNQENLSSVLSDDSSPTLPSTLDLETRKRTVEKLIASALEQAENYRISSDTLDFVVASALEKSKSESVFSRHTRGIDITSTVCKPQSELMSNLVAEALSKPKQGSFDQKGRVRHFSLENPEWRKYNDFEQQQHRASRQLSQSLYSVMSEAKSLSSMYSQDSDVIKSGLINLYRT